MVYGLSGSMACVVFPDQGSNPCVQHWQTNSLPLSHQGSLCPSLPDLTSLSMIISSSIYVAANGIISFIFMTEWYPHMCVCVCLCVWISVQFSSVTQSCPPPCNPMDCSTPGFPVHHQLLELLKLMSIESSGSFCVSQLFVSGGQSIGVSVSASVRPMNIQG